jgi:hypothetical protein
MIDFFGNLELQGQDGVNSQHAAQALQDLAVVSYTSNIVVDGPPALSRVNHHWSFWGQAQKSKEKSSKQFEKSDKDDVNDGKILVDNNAAFQCAAIDHIKYYKSGWDAHSEEPLEYIKIFSDGCASQNKSRYVLNWCSQLCDHFGLECIV